MIPSSPLPQAAPLPPAPDVSALAAGRMHEAAGPGRRVFALALAGQLAEADPGPASCTVLWIVDARRSEGFCPAGLAALIDPARLVLARPTGLIAALQVAEEALRSGAVPFVVADLEEAPDLTQSRRLQLAAGTGGGRGLCLVPEGRLRSNAAETRWHCAPIPQPRQAEAGQRAQHGAPQHWELVKNKRGPLGAWDVAVGRLRPPDAPLPARPRMDSRARQQASA
ncbi:MAG: hypothetical protein AAF074_20265 [Pseudomonadota bacterium]